MLLLEAQYSQLHARGLICICETDKTPPVEFIACKNGE